MAGIDRWLHYTVTTIDRFHCSCKTKPIYTTIGSTVLCSYNQVAVVTSTFCIETSETVPNMCVVVERVMLYQVTL